MSEITSQMVKSLREKTGAGMMDCKKALGESSGDFDKAVEFLRKQGLKSVEKRAGKVAAEGVIFSYIHPGSKVGVILELNCETDFVARGDSFQNLAKDIAMHIAWAKPRFVNREEISAEVINSERAIIESQLDPKQMAMADKIVTGKLEKFFEDSCLVDQIDVKQASGKKKIKDLINDISATVGEKVSVRRFARYEVGEGIEKAVVDYAAEVKAAAGV